MHLKKKGWLKHWDFILVDLLCLNFTFLFSYWIRLGVGNMYAVSGYRMLIVLVMILHFCIMFFTNCYSGILRRGYFDEFKVVVLYNTELIALLFAYLFVMQMGRHYARTILVGFYFLDTIVMYLAHIIVKKVYQANGTEKSNKTKLLVLVDEEDAKKAIDKITNGPDNSYDIIGISLRKKSQTKQIMGISVVCSGKEVYEYICRNVVDNVLICLNATKTKDIERITNNLLQMGVTVQVGVNMFGDGLPNVYFGRLNNLAIMTASMKVITPAQQLMKRCIDICGGIVGCLITAVLFIFVAPAIKIADPKGPIFFWQYRAGRNGRVFKIYKFRSMYTDAEERKKEYMEKNKMEGLMFKLENDPRIIGSGPDGTKKGLGFFLRTLSIDEFPNFWSVLKGDMSLVGTRPPTLDEYEKYELHHKSRLAIKPGLTGLWQVSGRSDLTNFEEIVKLDNEYIYNWSVGLDLKIILKTILVVLKRNGSL